MTKKMMTVASAAALATGANAAIVDLTPTDIHGDDTTTASYSDGDLTLTPYVGGVADTFNGNSARLGIDDNGSNANAFNDQDGVTGNADDETLEFVFSANAGLTGIKYDFSRARGPLATDGVTISGFLADPGATLVPDGGDATAIDQSSVSYDAGSGTLQLIIDGGDFTGTDVTLALAVSGASAGQTLTLAVHDSVQTGAQLAITGISYDNDTVAVPEPASAALLGLGTLLIARRRRSA